MRTTITVLFLALLGTTANAQCPGGVCPVNRAPAVIRTPVRSIVYNSPAVKATVNVATAPTRFVVQNCLPVKVVTYTPSLPEVRVVTRTSSLPEVKMVTRTSSNHWSYPGDISSHLQTVHGRSVSNLSIEQQLSLHDSLHQSTRSVVTTRRRFFR